jgi:GNAT superfamily N-acetyltransferase
MASSVARALGMDREMAQTAPHVSREDERLRQRMRVAEFLSSGGVDDESRVRIDAYNANARPVDLSCRPLMHELTVSVFWPHREDDLDLFIALGKGYLALDDIGRPLGSAMYFPMGHDFAMFGMMVTTPRLQSQGAGRWLLRQIMRDCDGRDLRLSATRSGYRLYEAAGFTPVGLIRQHQGPARRIYPPEPAPGVEIRPLAAEDMPALRALDAAAYGAPRDRIIDALTPLSSGAVALCGGELRGYALMRRFGKGQVIGPVVAESDRMAMQLTAPLIQSAGTGFVRLDTPVESDLFAAFLSAAGLGVFDTVTEMRVGPHRRATGGPVLYGLAAHSLG